MRLISWQIENGSGRSVHDLLAMSKTKAPPRDDIRLIFSCMNMGSGSVPRKNLDAKRRGSAMRFGSRYFKRRRIPKATNAGGELPEEAATQTPIARTVRTRTGVGHML